MRNENDAISYFDDLQQQVSILQQSIKMLVNYQKELDLQIVRLTDVKIKDMVSEILKELNKREKTDITSFDDLLTLNAKMAIKKAS